MLMCQTDDPHGAVDRNLSARVRSKTTLLHMHAYRTRLHVHTVREALECTRADTLALHAHVHAHVHVDV